MKNQIKNNLNLAEINTHSMTAVLQSNTERLWSAHTKELLVETVKEIFNENKIDTVASKRLIENMSKSRSLENAQITLTNSMLCGFGLGLN